MTRVALDDVSVAGMVEAGWMDLIRARARARVRIGKLDGSCVSAIGTTAESGSE